MFIGEAPGQEEDFHGIPFIGEEGNLLTEMLRAMQLTREEVFITNILKCRLPDNRNPHVDEIHACRDYLHRQIALINPKMIITFGQVSAQTLLATTDTIENLRGKIHQFQHKPLITVYHPNYMLRSPIEKSKTWHDLQFALEAFKRHQ
jgi:DNA polymerase